MQGGSQHSLLANAQQVYGATVIKNVHVIAHKPIMTVEAASLSGSGCWCETINLVYLPLYRMVAEFKGDWNFEGASTVSNYSTASEPPFQFPFPFPSFLVLPLPSKICYFSCIHEQLKYVCRDTSGSWLRTPVFPRALQLLGTIIHICDIICRWIFVVCALGILHSLNICALGVWKMLLSDVCHSLTAASILFTCTTEIASFGSFIVNSPGWLIVKYF